jgi:site-specific DNA-methyltransferase (adenine-specific)
MANETRIKLLAGDCIEHLQQMEDDSVDAICIDPPAGIAFMGKAWDSDRGGRDAWIEWLSGIMAELLRVTKPGGHMLCWALPRTQHWTATAIENAGWDVRDVLMHVFGSGFPKSSSVPIGIDKKLGAMGHRGKARHGHATGEVANGRENLNAPHAMPEHKGITPEAKQWAGWGTALKPSHEAWILARKPLAGTVAATVLEHGTGALNIDGCRVAHGTDVDLSAKQRQQNAGGAVDGAFGAAALIGSEIPKYKPAGRWPPHLLLSHAAACGEKCADGCPVAEMDAQSGISASGVAVKRNLRSDGASQNLHIKARTQPGDDVGYGDTGGASRFFPVFRYVAKPSTAEKSAGLHGRNEHATVKSIELMRWLVRLITPPAGLVLDCFMGSGTTGIAAVLEGARFVGIEQRPAMVEVARKRIAHWETGAEIDAPEAPKAGDEPAGPRQMGLFG